MITTVKKAELTKKFGKSEKDSGSVAVQVAIITERIKTLTPHFEKNKKDHSGMRGLLRLIGRRKALLKYLAQKDESQYQKVITDLGIRK